MLRLAGTSMTIALALALSASVSGQNTSVKVLIAGSGAEPHINTVLDGIVDQLSAAHFDVKPAAGENKSRTAALERLKTSDADSLVFVTVELGKGGIGDRSKITVQCFDKQGSQLWSEEVMSGMMSMGTGGTINSMLKNMKKKIEVHIGQPGLSKK